MHGEILRDPANSLIFKQYAPEFYEQNKAAHKLQASTYELLNYKIPHSCSFGEFIQDPTPQNVGYFIPNLMRCSDDPLTDYTVRSESIMIAHDRGDANNPSYTMFMLVCPILDTHVPRFQILGLHNTDNFIDFAKGFLPPDEIERLRNGNQNQVSFVYEGVNPFSALVRDFYKNTEGILVQMAHVNDQKCVDGELDEFNEQFINGLERLFMIRVERFFVPNILIMAETLREYNFSCIDTIMTKDMHSGSVIVSRLSDDPKQSDYALLAQARSKGFGYIMYFSARRGKLGEPNLASGMLWPNSPDPRQLKVIIGEIDEKLWPNKEGTATIFHRPDLARDRYKEEFYPSIDVCNAASYLGINGLTSFPQTEEFPHVSSEVQDEISRVAAEYKKSRLAKVKRAQLACEAASAT